MKVDNILRKWKSGPLRNPLHCRWYLGSVGLASWEIRGSADLRKTLNLAGCKKRTRWLNTKLSASQQNEEKAWRWNQAVEINEESYKIELFNNMKTSLRANPYLWSHPLTFRIWMLGTWTWTRRTWEESVVGTSCNFSSSPPRPSPSPQVQLGFASLDLGTWTWTRGTWAESAKSTSPRCRTYTIVFFIEGWPFEICLLSAGFLDLRMSLASDNWCGSQLVQQCNHASCRFNCPHSKRCKTLTATKSLMLILNCTDLQKFGNSYEVCSIMSLV